ncbi:MAG: phosphohistidine phosphatase SixA [Gemmatimonadota bacterium]
MEIYLVQHGEAKSEEEDNHRPLTDVGMSEVAAVAVALKRHDLRVSAIWHSGKLRAKQTAVEYAEALEPGDGVHEKAGLGPQDDPQRMAEALVGLDVPTMVVGHLPHLSRLVSLLTVDDPDREIVRFRQGGVLCLARTEGGWRIAWYLTPELAEVVTA